MTNLRSQLHLKYQRNFKLSEEEMRWCERITAMGLMPMTMTIVRFASTRNNLLENVDGNLQLNKGNSAE